MTQQLTRFDTTALRRALVGSDIVFDAFETRFANQLTNNYPPHNVVKTDDTHYVIEIAVAGFKKSEIAVEIEQDVITVFCIPPPITEATPVIQLVEPAPIKLI